MMRIRDLEEKRCIMAFHKCSSNRSRGKVFCNSSIYNDWWRWWGRDFPRNNNGKPMQIYRNQFVLSAKKHRKGKTPKRYEEYTEVLSSITEWINKNYKQKQTRAENRERFYNMLIELRKENYNSLVHILKDSGLADKGYSIQDASSDNIYDLRNYCLIHIGDTITVKNGSYEIILEHLEELQKGGELNG